MVVSNSSSSISNKLALDVAYGHDSELGMIAIHLFWLQMAQENRLWSFRVCMCHVMTLSKSIIHRAPINSDRCVGSIWNSTYESELK